MATPEQISPDYIAAKVIKLELADPLAVPRAFNAIDVAVSIDQGGSFGAFAAAAGLSLPLELTVTSPSDSGFERQVFRRVIPSLVTFTPKEGGAHLLRLRELGHNLWWGSIVIEVSGERADPRAVT